MREGRPRAVRSRPRLLPPGLSVLATLVAPAGGCATEVSTLEPPPPSAIAGSGSAAGHGGSNAPAGGKAPIAGIGTGGTGGGGTGVNAFGGTTTTGGKPSGGAGGAGAASQGGMASGGAGGAGGKGGASPGGAAGASGSGNAGSGGSGGSNLGCLEDWKGGACDTCSTQTQSDKLACVKILDCYAANACGPSTCSGNDDKCGANKIGQGTAGYPIAKQVYDCACQ